MVASEGTSVMLRIVAPFCQSISEPAIRGAGEGMLTRRIPKAPPYPAVPCTDLGYFPTVFESSTTIWFWKVSGDPKKCNGQHRRCNVRQKLFGRSSRLASLIPFTTLRCAHLSENRLSSSVDMDVLNGDFLLSH